MGILVRLVPCRVLKMKNIAYSYRFVNVRVISILSHIDDPLPPKSKGQIILFITKMDLFKH